eukprot:gene41306-50413_t
MATVLSQFLNAPFLILFSYCCYLQYQLMQLNWQQLGEASLPKPEVPYSVQHLLVRGSPANTPPLPLPAEQDQKIDRHIYGGKGDPTHLGGFITRDNETISYNLWNFMISELSVKSIVDVGCGKGFSSRYFYERGVRVTCVEGSSDAVKQSLLPPDVIVHHDFSLGPWWPAQTVDVAWSTEFVEHVGRQYMPNYMPIFKKAAIVMISTVGWGGWHHVEIHAPWWWIARMEANGFIYSKALTDKCRKEVFLEGSITGKNIQKLNAVLVFINPHVANLPQHRHLIGGHGCGKGVIDNNDGGIACTGVDALPEEYNSVMQCSRPDDSKLWVCPK